MLIQEEIYFKIYDLPAHKQICPNLILWYNSDTVNITSKYQKSPFSPMVSSQFSKSNTN